MRKQMKIAAVVSAAALLAIGASFTSMAAEKGTWKLEDGEWYCYDKDGEVIEEAFCLSNGKEYYVGEDGRLASSTWVEDGDATYFVNSAGEKIVNDWRYTTPVDDEEGDEAWYYFQSTGKRAENKKLVIDGKTYYFNADGEMLTGWVEKNGDAWDEATSDNNVADVVYCGEDGARLSKAWIYTYAPGVDEDEDDVDDEDMAYYYIKSSGAPATGKQNNINKQTYFFGADGKMLTGWVAKSGSSYIEIWDNDDDGDGYMSDEYKLGNFSSDSTPVYFCGDEDDGHMKKDKWIKVWNNLEYGADDDDNDEFWFYIKANGRVYIPESGTAAVRYKLDDGSADVDASADARFKTSTYDIDKDDNGIVATEYKINGKTYLFNEHGQMLNNFVKMNGKMYYYGGSDDGARKDGSVTVNDENGEANKCYFATKDDEDSHYYNAAGVNGNKNGKLYANGVLVTATDDKYEVKEVSIDGTTYSFIVNKSGSIQSSKDEYKEDGDVLIDATKATFLSGSGATKNSVKDYVLK